MNIKIKKNDYFDSFHFLNKKYKNSIKIIKKKFNKFIIQYNNIYFQNFNTYNINSFPQIYILMYNNTFIHYSFFISLYKKYLYYIINYYKTFSLDFHDIYYNKLVFYSIYSNYFYDYDFNIYSFLPNKMYNDIKFIKDSTLTSLRLHKYDKKLYYLLIKIKRTSLISTFINEYNICFHNFELMIKIKILIPFLYKYNIYFDILHYLI